VPPPNNGTLPVLKKQVFATIDARTTMVCLDAAGQIRDLDEPFDTLAGPYLTPPFHIHCRSAVLPWAAGVIGRQRDDANTEIQHRPAAQRRKDADGFHGRLPPPPQAGDVAATVLQATPSDATAGQRPPARITEWLPQVARLQRERAAGRGDRPGGDRALAAIARQRGDDLPQLVSGRELDRQVAAGAVEVWRGVTEREHANRLRSGPSWYGLAILGAGLYFALAEGDAQRFAGQHGAVVRAAVPPDAEIIDWGDLEVLYTEVLDSLSGAQRRRLAVILNDPGRFAAAMGYDAIRLPNGDLLVVRRGALAIAR
jgi:hypothetical protein